MRPESKILFLYDAFASRVVQPSRPLTVLINPGPTLVITATVTSLPYSATFRGFPLVTDIGYKMAKPGIEALHNYSPSDLSLLPFFSRVLSAGFVSCQSVPVE